MKVLYSQLPSQIIRTRFKDEDRDRERFEGRMEDAGAIEGASEYRKGRVKEDRGCRPAPEALTRSNPCFTNRAVRGKKPPAGATLGLHPPLPHQRTYLITLASVTL
ncbi:hypothetical protein HZH68_013358 [Vespula germanica]|uniref:Uncharacterized protein n=2 Tax=Vespula TaxID=7451 RepID=A0A834JCZ7_VESGE|nr:hypothetical protein HZH66_012108 [Vespula vulgaris]KAF7386226.1 hypothetical protein HZH68_013358 [Vespula germanica]